MKGYGEDIPKYRKKVRKQLKKSNHKHEYVLINVKENFVFSNSLSNEEKSYWVLIQEQCKVCNKIKEQTKFINYKDYLKIKGAI